MPEIKNIAGAGWRILIWETTEPLSFFETSIHLNAYELMRMRAFKHAGRALHFLCARFLLRKLLPEVPPHAFVAIGEIPIVDNEDVHISISHAGDYVSVMVHSQTACGIDIQDFDHRIIKIKDKFSTGAERALMPDALDELSACITLWAAKESIFKCMQIPGLDFRTDMVLKSATLHQLVFDFPLKQQTVVVAYVIDSNYVLAYCMRG